MLDGERSARAFGAALVTSGVRPLHIQQHQTNLLKAQNIIGELRACLNHEAGGPHAANLDRLYDYYMRRLMEANLKKQVKPLAEVEGLVKQLRDGWSEMLRSQDAGQVQSTRGVA